VAHTFEDRRGEMFGREPDIAFLMDRAQKQGLTAVVARPLMGKTWTLIETARRLREENNYIVGYHESKASEQSHLLYAVSDLYTRWLADNSLWAQAKSEWERHKGDLVPKVGKLVATLFEKLNKLTRWAPESASSVVRATFDGLAEAQRDLVTGGLLLSPLDYDQARDLARLVRQVSGRRVVLILDAWENSRSVHFEHQTLEAFINHLRDWPEGHIFLGIRKPELDNKHTEGEAFKKAEDLSKRSAAATVYRLPPMHLDERSEQRNMVGHIRQRVPAVSEIGDDVVLEMVDRFPGVLDRWLEESNRTAMRGGEDLKQSAMDAQDYRYREFDRLLPDLSVSERTLAARLAFFPRLDEQTWRLFREILVAGISEEESVFDELVNETVLENQDYPTYGHDTRHAAAGRWFTQHLHHLIKSEGTKIIWRTAGQVVRVHEQTRPFAAALAACTDLADQLNMDKATRCLTDAGLSLFGYYQVTLPPEFDAACRQAIERDVSVTPLVAQALNNRGVRKGQLGDSDGEMQDYSAVIEMADAPPEQIAKALNNRGVRKGQLGDRQSAIEALKASAEIFGALEMETEEDAAQELINQLRE
jgi:hypothetical protein